MHLSPFLLPALETPLREKEAEMALEHKSN